MLFDARGNPIPVTDPRKDNRTEQQKEFDRKFRQQMGDNGGQFLPRQFIDNVKRMMFRRDLENAIAKDAEENDKRSSLDDFADRALHDQRTAKKKQVITH